MSYEKLLLQIEETNSDSETSRCDLCHWLVKSHSDPRAESLFFHWHLGVLKLRTIVIYKVR